LLLFESVVVNVSLDDLEKPRFRDESVEIDRVGRDNDERGLEIELVAAVDLDLLFDVVEKLELGLFADLLRN
jgi:hypothetical protein